MISFWNVLFLLIFLVCLVGLVIPIFPGLQLMWAGMVLYWTLAAMTGVAPFNGWLFAVITILMVAGTLVDNIILAKQLRTVNTPWFSIGFAYLAGLICGLVFTPIIAIVATPAALFLAEYLRLRDLSTSKTAVRQWLFSVGWTFLARLVLGLLMVSVWGFSLFLNK